MKVLPVVLLVCLLVAGTVSAVAVNTGSAGASKVVVTTTHPTMNTSSASKASVIATGAGRGMLEVYSVPSGATVYLDGNSNPGDKTPVKYSLPAGSHTVMLALTGYQYYNETFTLDTGAIRDINADLKKIPADSGPARATGTMDTIKPGNAVTLVNTPGSVTRKTTSPTQTTLFVTTTPPAPWACPDSDWSCLTEAEAAQQFGYPNARYGDEPCEWMQVSGGFIPKYCFIDVDTGGKLSQSALLATGIKDGDNIYILNQTWIQHTVVKKSTGVQKTSEANSNPVQSFFDFLSGILSGSAKPESRLEIVGFNPCPEPPGKELVGNIQK
jgi:hypothetical protein